MKKNIQRLNGFIHSQNYLLHPILSFTFAKQKCTKISAINLFAVFFLLNSLLSINSHLMNE